jgi:hypothetical protein
MISRKKLKYLVRMLILECRISGTNENRAIDIESVRFATDQRIKVGEKEILIANNVAISGLSLSMAILYIANIVSNRESDGTTSIPEMPNKPTNGKDKNG